MEKFFAGETFTREEIIKALNSGVSDGSVIPVYACAGYTCEAIDMLLDEIVYSAPSAADKAGENGLPCDENGPLAAICFKTIAVRRQDVLLQGRFRQDNFGHPRL